MTAADTGFTREPTSEMSVVRRSGLLLLRPLAKVTSGFLGGIGERVVFMREVGRAFGEVRTWMPLVIPQMRAIGVDSVPLAGVVAAFIGGVIALQVRYQLFPGIDLSVVGLSVRQMIVLELGPLLTGLVLAGRVGARMTAEIGTMRVTEQIDALETLAYDPVAYLVVPRLIAATLMLPLVVICANVIGILSGLATALLATDVHYYDFYEGIRLGYGSFQVVYSLIKATMFGTSIAYLCTYEGYRSGAGAEGVGRSTARAVVYTSVAILLLDAITAFILARYLQA
ncbi:MAG TPA: ABC transporter permease [Gemmatimonadaceae bacterium]|nr:ABC transporter permease [Gemmatimonadaceae bacterium]